MLPSVRKVGEVYKTGHSHIPRGKTSNCLTSSSVLYSAEGPGSPAAPAPVPSPCALPGPAAPPGSGAAWLAPPGTGTAPSGVPTPLPLLQLTQQQLLKIMRQVPQKWGQKEVLHCPDFNSFVFNTLKYMGLGGFLSTSAKFWRLS